MNKKILGCLLGAAVGDAMGAATETKSIRQIKKNLEELYEISRRHQMTHWLEEEGQDKLQTLLVFHIF